MPPPSNHPVLCRMANCQNTLALPVAKCGVLFKNQTGVNRPRLFQSLNCASTGVILLEVLLLCGVMVSTWDFGSHSQGSSPCTTTKLNQLNLLRMEDKKNGNSKYGQYKELIDFVYNLTSKDEYKDGFSAYKNVKLSRIVTELVKRGVLKKTQYFRGANMGRYYGFKWVARSAPTLVFVKSVADSINTITREQNKSWRERKNASVSNVSPVSTPIQPIQSDTTPFRSTNDTEQVERVERHYAIVDPIDYKKYIDGLTDQELWDILKRRGACIKDNRLVIVREFELD